jgi:hypothetical protein
VDALECLCKSCPTNKAELLALGGVADLGRLLKDKDHAVKRNAALALATLCEDHPETQFAVYDKGEGGFILRTLCKLLWDKNQDVAENARVVLDILEKGGYKVAGVEKRMRELRQDRKEDSGKQNTSSSSVFLDDAEFKYSSPRKAASKRQVTSAEFEEELMPRKKGGE